MTKTIEKYSNLYEVSCESKATTFRVEVIAHSPSHALGLARSFGREHGLPTAGLDVAELEHDLRGADWRVGQEYSDELLHPGNLCCVLHPLEGLERCE